MMAVINKMDELVSRLKRVCADWRDARSVGAGREPQLTWGYSCALTTITGFPLVNI